MADKIEGIPEWMPKGQKLIQQCLESMAKDWAEGNLVSVMLFGEGADGQMYVYMTEPDSYFRVLGYLSFMTTKVANDIQASATVSPEPGEEG